MSKSRSSAIFEGKPEDGQSLGEYTTATSRCCTAETRRPRTQAISLTPYRGLLAFGLWADGSRCLLTLTWILPSNAKSRNCSPVVVSLVEALLAQQFKVRTLSEAIQ